MPGSVATALCAIFVIALCVRDMRRSPGVSLALWVPIAWLTMIGSRFPSEWLGAGMSLDSPDALLEGSPVDRNAFLVLIVAAFLILLSRKTSWRQFFENNPWISLFFIYTAISILWSDFPLTAFKRWHKVVGHIMMALVVMTELDPVRAMESLFKRCGYLLIAVSILFIKYLPNLGRGYDRWTYQVINVGITTNKNSLGNLCLVFGLFFGAAVLIKRRDADGPGKWDFYINVVMLLMVLWLLSLANSATSLMCLVLGGAVIVLTRPRFIARHFTAIAIVTCVVLGSLQLAFNVKDKIIVGLGRDTTLTGRTELWGILQQIPTNPLVGVGFESFWLGKRAEYLWQIYWWKPNQAHNGYYETYLNIGLIGVTLQIGMMLTCFFKARRKMLALLTPEKIGSVDFAMARFSLAFLFALTAYNFTEATFKAVHLSFFVFFLVSTDYPRREQEMVEAVAPTEQPRSQPRPFVMRPARVPAALAARGKGAEPRCT